MFISESYLSSPPKSAYLTILQWHDPGIISSTKYIVVSRDRPICFLSKLFQTVYFRI